MIVVRVDKVIEDIFFAKTSTIEDALDQLGEFEVRMQLQSLLAMIEMELVRRAKKLI